MDKQEHADKLRDAIKANPGSRQRIADATGRSYRTIGNWTSPTDPTMPSLHEREVIRVIVGAYDAEGDDVERAIRNSPLIEWRQDTVIGFYKRHLAEQREQRQQRSG